MVSKYVMSKMLLFSNMQNGLCENEAIRAIRVIDSLTNFRVWPVMEWRGKKVATGTSANLMNERLNADQKQLVFVGDLRRNA